MRLAGGRGLRRDSVKRRRRLAHQPVTDGGPSRPATRGLRGPWASGVPEAAFCGGTPDVEPLPSALLSSLDEAPMGDAGAASSKPNERPSPGRTLRSIASTLYRR